MPTPLQKQREHERAMKAQARARALAEKESLRAIALAKKEAARAEVLATNAARLAHTKKRAAQVESMNKDLRESVEECERLLRHSLKVDSYIDFDDLKNKPKLAPAIPRELEVAEPRPRASDAPRMEAAEPSPRDEDFLPRKPGGIGRVLPGSASRYQKRLMGGEARLREAHEAYASRLRATETEHAARLEAEAARHQVALTKHAERELARNTRLDAARRAHALATEQNRSAMERQHAEIDSFREAFNSRESAAVVRYFALVLKGSRYPKSFPQHAKLAYVPESLQLVVEYDLPTIACIPEQANFKYVQAKDEVASTDVSAVTRRVLYSSVLSQLCLRTIFEIFKADRLSNVDSVVFNGHIDTIDLGTGKKIRPCLLTVRASRDKFLALDLANVDPAACLKGLNASVSRSPSELLPVRPVLEFNMVDSRFVKETDVLSGLDQRPNLMTLTPSEFESLITNLFEKMGLETRLTQASRDGGVDCVAFDPRPIFGGKVVIQAKRYKNTVGVSAVRDLFGTMQNEGASKGILVTTSGYGKASFDFADGKPLELLSGTNLLYLLAEHAGIEARIEPPDEWSDPIPDS